MVKIRAWTFSPDWCPNIPPWLMPEHSALTHARTFSPDSCPNIPPWLMPERSALTHARTFGLDSCPNIQLWLMPERLGMFLNWLKTIKLLKLSCSLDPERLSKHVALWVTVLSRIIVYVTNCTPNCTSTIHQITYPDCISTICVTYTYYSLNNPHKDEKSNGSVWLWAMQRYHYELTICRAQSDKVKVAMVSQISEDFCSLSPKKSQHCRIAQLLVFAQISIAHELHDVDLYQYQQYKFGDQKHTTPQLPWLQPAQLTAFSGPGLWQVNSLHLTM